MAGSKVSALVLMAVAGMALAGCQDGAKPFSFLKQKGSGAAGASADGTAPEERSVKLVDRDVEAPNIFHVKAEGLWDGRPSLGGVWVAYPGVQNPERVIIRNPKNGKFVIGALFRRENNNPGPKLQMSSDAATALGLYAGEPAMVSVTALRREETSLPEPNAKAPALSANEQISSKPLTDVSAKAGAAIGKAEASKTAAKAPAPKKPEMRHEKKTEAKAAATREALKYTGGRDYLQIGIFSIKANADRAANMLAKAGGEVHIRHEESQGKTFWRVVVGPATAKAQRDALLAKAKKLGFGDAYFVTR